MKKKRQSTVIFLRSEKLPDRAAVEAALAECCSGLSWHEEHETERGLAATVNLGDSQVALSILAIKLEPDLYADPLEVSGLSAEEKAMIEGHGSHARLVYIDESAPVEAVDRMALVYRVASRIAALDGVAVLAPASGVFILGLQPEHVDEAMKNETPPLDMWVALEKTEEDVVRTVGASYLDLPEVEAEGIGILDPETTFSTVMDVLLYLRRIRRELIPGETLHVGDQPFRWMTMRSSDGSLRLRRVELNETIES